ALLDRGHQRLGCCSGDGRDDADDGAAACHGPVHCQRLAALARMGGDMRDGCLRARDDRRVGRWSAGVRTRSTGKNKARPGDRARYLKARDYFAEATLPNCASKGLYASLARSASRAPSLLASATKLSYEVFA